MAGLTNQVNVWHSDPGAPLQWTPIDRYVVNLFWVHLSKVDMGHSPSDSYPSTKDIQLLAARCDLSGLAAVSCFRKKFIDF